jgi:integrase
MAEAVTEMDTPTTKAHQSAPSGSHISVDGWETNANWPRGLMLYVSSGTYFARAKKNPFPPKKKSLKTKVYSVACGRLQRTIAELKKELEKRAKQGKGIEPTTWGEAAAQKLKHFEWEAARGEKKHISLDQLDNVVRRIYCFWPALQHSVAKDLLKDEALQFLTEARSGTGRFQIAPGQQAKKTGKNGFKYGPQGKASYNKMLCYLKIITTVAINMDKEKGLSAFTNQFEDIEENRDPDPAPDLPSTTGFSNILEKIRFPFEKDEAGEDYLNFSCAKFMSGNGARIGEVMGKMEAHHEKDEPHPGCRWKDFQDENPADKHFVIYSEKKRKGQRLLKRKVPFITGMEDFVKELRSRLYKGDPEALVFEGVSLNRGVNVQLKRACKKLKLAKITQQDLRHYFVTTCVESGMDYKTIAEWVGHKDGGILIATVYGHLRPEHSQEMAKRVTLAQNQGAKAVKLSTLTPSPPDFAPANLGGGKIEPEIMVEGQKVPFSWMLKIVQAAAILGVCTVTASKP